MDYVEPSGPVSTSHSSESTSHTHFSTDPPTSSNKSRQSHYPSPAFSAAPSVGVASIVAVKLVVALG